MNRSKDHVGIGSIWASRMASALDYSAFGSTSTPGICPITTAIWPSS